MNSFLLVTVTAAPESMITLPNSGFDLGAFILVSLGLDRPRVDIVHIVQALYFLCFRCVLFIVILIFPWDSLRAIFWRWVKVALIIVVIAILVGSVTLLVSLILVSKLSLKIIIIVTCITIHLIVLRRIAVGIEVLAQIISALLVVWLIPSSSLKVSIRFVLSWLVDIWLFIRFIRALKRSMAQPTATVASYQWSSTHCFHRFPGVESFTLQSLILCVDHFKYHFNCWFLAGVFKIYGNLMVLSPERS